MLPEENGSEKPKTPKVPNISDALASMLPSIVNQDVEKFTKTDYSIRFNPPRPTSKSPNYPRKIELVDNRDDQKTKFDLPTSRINHKNLNETKINQHVSPSTNSISPHISSQDLESRQELSLEDKINQITELFQKNSNIISLLNFLSQGDLEIIVKYKQEKTYISKNNVDGYDPYMIKGIEFLDNSLDKKIYEEDLTKNNKILDSYNQIKDLEKLIVKDLEVILSLLPEIFLKERLLKSFLTDFLMNKGKYSPYTLALGVT